MSVHKKLMQARLALQARELKKSGHNKFAGYQYFELGDFIPTVQSIFDSFGLCGVVSYGVEIATLTITDIESGTSIEITSPMSEAALKGCHAVQNLGAVQTYIRRYLWVTAMEIVEHDVIDSTSGNKKQNIKPVPKFPESAKSVSNDVWDGMSENEQADLSTISQDVLALMGKPTEAIEYIQSLELSADHKVALNSLFDSKTRAALKAASIQLREAA